MELEDEAHGPVAEGRDLGFRAREHVRPIDQQPSAGRRIQAAEEMEECALPDSGLADHRHPLARRNVEVEATQHLDHGGAVDVALLQAPSLYERRHPG